jgi:hypothetical protein
VNIVTSEESWPDGVQLSQAQTGVVTFSGGAGHTLVARTDDQCPWTLIARGNTAELNPPAQICQLPDSTVTMNFWSIASDGRCQAAVMSGVVQDTDVTSNFYLGNGSLSKEH